MELVFRKFTRGDNPVPEPGEVYLRLGQPGHGDRRDLATLIVDQGPDALLRGDGLPRLLIVTDDPTLDDLLAATFAMRLLDGGSLPTGAKMFARYTALAREGLKPGEIPLEESLEGIFLALRNAHGGNLADPAVAAKFRADWERMSAVILAAIDKNIDPFRTALFAGPDFARERSFLSRDHDVFRQDVLRGERWQVAIPEGPPKGYGLLLRQPKSLLFKYWSRQPQDNVEKLPYLFLAVLAREGQWIFSTDPVHRLPLKPLADALQKAETTKDAARAAADPWFDGKPFGYTLVAAPRGNTLLAENEVRKIACHWTRASVLRAGRSAVLLKAGLALAACVLVAVGSVVFYGRLFGTTPAEPIVQGPRLIGNGEIERNVPDSPRGTLHVLSIGVSEYQKPEYRLNFAHKDADDLAAALTQFGQPLFRECKVRKLLNQEATRRAILRELKELLTATQHDLVVLTVAGHGANLFAGSYFTFLPHDFDDRNELDTVIYWEDFQRILKQLPCPVIVLMDTCHSGTITRELRGFTPDVGDELKQILKKNPPQGKGIIVMAGCLGGQKSRESATWGHGAVSLAFLEALTGKLQADGDASELPKGTADGAVSWKDVDYYISRRVARLTGQQAVVSNHTGDLDLSRVFLAQRKR